MARPNQRPLARQWAALFNQGVIREWTDGQLLERFVTGPREAAELAFAALVERHTAMVLRVCRSQLADTHAAQDATQATFLVLIQQARGLWVRDSIGPWLHQVAYRTALAAQRRLARQRRRDRMAPDPAWLAGCPEAALRQRERERILHEEIDRLPARLRHPIVLCDLEGQSCEDAARHLGRPIGTIKSWRSRARAQLRERLRRRGLDHHDLGLLVAGSNANPIHHAPLDLTRTADRLAADLTTGTVPNSVRRLAQGVMMTMLASQLRIVAISLLAIASLTVGVAAFAQRSTDASARPEPAALPPIENAQANPVPVALPTEPPPAKRPPEDATWTLTLHDAILMGLENLPDVRVERRGDLQTGESRWVVPTKDIEINLLRAELMARIRLIEQTYWELCQHYLNLSASLKSTELAEALLHDVEARLVSGLVNVADREEVIQRLIQLRLDNVVKESDVQTTAQQLRKLIGVTTDDHRQILPATSPTEPRITPDPQESRTVMLNKQPDIVRISRRVQSIQKQLAQIELETIEGRQTWVGPSDRKSSPSLLTLQTQLEDQKILLAQFIDQADQTLRLASHEVNDTYSEIQTASRFLRVAVQRVEAQRGFYDEGRITVDRYLDAITQHAAAQSQEAHFRYNYQLALLALEQARGTLLDREGLSVQEARDGGQATIRPGIGPMTEFSAIRRPPGGSSPSNKRSASQAERGDDLSDQILDFHLSLGRGPQPWEIRGSIRVRRAQSNPGSDQPGNGE